ncbi:MAG: AI-2E family transporter, partial [Pseudomonadota bacterium]
MDSSTKTGIWIIAAGVIIALLYLGRDIMAPFALAVFLFLVVEGFARLIDDKVKFIASGWSRAIAILGVIGGFVLFIGVLAQGIAQFGAQS